MWPLKFIRTLHFVRQLSKSSTDTLLFSIRSLAHDLNCKTWIIIPILWVYAKWLISSLWYLEQILGLTFDKSSNLTRTVFHGNRAPACSTDDEWLVHCVIHSWRSRLVPSSSEYYWTLLILLSPYWKYKPLSFSQCPPQETCG